MSQRTQIRLKEARQADLTTQKKCLAAIIQQTPMYQQLRNALAASKEPLPVLWVGAGAITQSIWNLLHHWPAETFLKDIDLIYFDADPSWEAENARIQQIQKLTPYLPWPLDIKNVGRIHVWYHQRFGGNPLPPFENPTEAVKTWPFTASAVALHIFHHQSPEHPAWIAPFGFDDLLAMRLRPNQRLASAAVCKKKAERWLKQWPQLTLLKDSQLR